MSHTYSRCKGVMQTQDESADLTALKKFCGDSKRYKDIGNVGMALNGVHSQCYVPIRIITPG